MREKISYILLVIFVYSIIGYYPIFILMQNSVKEEMKERIKNVIPSEEMIIFNFNETDYMDLVWEDDNEFRYKGDMYDVIRIVKSENNNIRVYCIDDKKETKLLADFEKQTQNNSTDGQQKQNIVKLFTSFYLLVKESNSFIPDKLVLSAFDFKKSFISFIGDIPAPPPKSV